MFIVEGGAENLNLKTMYDIKRQYREPLPNCR